MKRVLIALALAAAALATPAWADCYTVFQRNLIVYRAEVTPIDLAPPIHAQLQKQFPGGQLVISSDVKTCTYISPSSPVDPVTGAAAAPGSERAGLSVVPGPLAGMSANAGAMPVAAQQPAAEVGCRRGGTVTRRGEPCPDTEVIGQRVVGAQQDGSVVTDRVKPMTRR